ncbi:MAG: hypothetical protein M1838_001829 [Thelocarpon superellum]|nr:MAG: hypothetical protein M1838_001829 [Thelocarpon superellum]
MYRPPCRDILRVVELVKEYTGHVYDVELSPSTPRSSVGSSVHDAVILRRDSNPNAPSQFIPKLEEDGQFHSHRGYIRHADIIGKGVREVVETTQGKRYRIHVPTLAEYVTLRRRHVTPIYPADANLIVSLLDIHADRSIRDDKLEILEAGTGQGSLTLHLARAIHGANPPTPYIPEVPHADDGGATAAAVQSTEYTEWRQSRNAIIHSVEVSPKYSYLARHVVYGFRHGLYYPDVDFHTSDVSQWLDTHANLHGRNTAAFLSHAILDLPSSELHLPRVAQALHPDGALLTFNPSITQVMACAAHVKAESLPLVLARVLELGLP